MWVGRTRIKRSVSFWPKAVAIADSGGIALPELAAVLERECFFSSLRDDLAQLAKDLQAALDEGFDAAQKRLAKSPSAEAAVVAAGLAVAHQGAESAEEAMAGALALQRMKLERRLAYLATLGNNAPFIGLFGTVIGVVMSFEALGQQAKEASAAAAQLAPASVMSSIGEALVATAVGIGVAIPAVAANNFFQRTTRGILANTEALSRVLLAHLKAEPGTTGKASVASTKEATSKESKGSKLAKNTRAEKSEKQEKGDDEEKG
jgi:biopolymer transport protein ExbB